MNLSQQSEPEFATQVTHWRNPTDQVVTVDLYVGVGRVPPPAAKPGGHPSGYERGQAHKAHLTVTWKPKETKSLPSEFDAAIHDVRNGVIVGGKAPQLRRVDAPNQPMADAVDVAGLAKAKAVEEARAALVAKEVAETTLMVATAKAHEAEVTLEAAAEERATPAPEAPPEPSDPTDELVAPKRRKN